MLFKIILLFLFLSPAALTAQNLWNKFYTGFRPQSLIKLSNEDYLISGNDKGDIHLLRIDFNGNQIEKVICDKPNSLSSTDYRVYHTLETEDRHLLLVGTNATNASNYDLFLIKATYSGDTLWTKNYGGNNRDEAYAADVTIDGGYIIAGYTESFGADWSDIWLLKTDSDGDTVWTRKYGFEYYDEAYVIKETDDEGFIIGGSTGTPGNEDIWVLKLNVYGDTLWSRIYGGPFHDHINSLIETIDGGYLIAGSSWSYSNGQMDMWLIKIDSQGDTLWTQTFGGEFGDSAEEVIQLENENFVVAGYIGQIEGDLFGSPDACLLKVNDRGEILWSKLYGGIYPDEAISVVEYDDKGLIVLGNSYSFDADIWLFKTDQDGNSIVPTSIEKKDEHLKDHQMISAFPNPFNHSTTIEFSIPYSEFTSLIIYDLNSRITKKLLNKYLPGGKYSISWNGKNDENHDISSGIYIYELRSSSELIARGKLFFVK